jgi:hypothetical protein
MRAAGIADVLPSNVKLLAALEQGATVDEFRAAATKAVQHGKGFGYALGIVKGDRDDAARMSLAPPSKTNGASRFALPPGHVNVLPEDLPDLNVDDEKSAAEAHHGDDARARH